jgi:NAD(P)-dependent dehydrogenase (short-subunit alcohol dehydrogenase family)
MPSRKSSLFRLDNKIALVTGCGSIGPGLGNGRAIATLFARQGARIYGVDIELAAAVVTRDVILEEGGSCEIATCDVTDGVAVKAMIADCVARFGRIDILVNNVGRSEPGGPVELDEESWDRQLDVNLKSAYLTCKHVLPLMELQGGGAIVNISSVAGLRHIGKPQVAYASGKAALMQMSRTTAVLYAARGIRINCVVPGLMDTPLVRRLADNYAGGDFDGFVATRNKQVPMGRMGVAWDVAYAALFLAADESNYVTGTEVVVDGGLIAATR